MIKREHRRIPIDSPAHREVLKKRDQSRAVISELKRDFNEAHGSLSEFLASEDPEKSRFAHEYLFTKAMEAPPGKRNQLHLAHLALERQYHKKTKIDSPYGEETGKSGMRKAEIFPMLFSFEQALANDQELIKSSTRDMLLRVDLKDMIPLVLSFVHVYERMKGLLAEKYKGESVSGIDHHTMVSLLAAQSTVVKYFGYPDKHTESRNRTRYHNRRAKLTDFGKEKSATCTEFSLLAQQLLAFAGIRTTFISGAAAFGDTSENVGFYGAHSFNLITTTQGEKDAQAHIYDASNPLLVNDSQEPSAKKMKLYLAPLTREQRERFESGNDVDIEYGGEYRSYGVT